MSVPKLNPENTGNRIAARFELLAKHKRPGLVTFITANDPTPGVFMDILEGLPAAGADLIEIGIPFSDPAADGPAIQLSGQRALKHGTKIDDVLEAVREFRRDEIDTPIILMGYYNPIYHYGDQEFAEAAAKAGVDGVIVVDLPPEESEELHVHLRANDIHMIFLSAPTSSDARLPTILGKASGFVYYVAITGITGTASASEDAVKAATARLRRHTTLPIAVGFGIRTPQQAYAIGKHADAAVVGSAIVDVIAQGVKPDGTVEKGLAVKVLEFVKSLATGVHGTWP
ncbi:MAG: tryptophan synthase subunit alpha [Rhodospirillaceae bacterium]|nr:tryptophan synthase subunit alpha [Rhodospirillaceae bacterium]